MKKIAIIMILIIILSLTCVPVVLAETTAEVVTNYDTTKVLDDLQSATIGGKKFDLNDYPVDPTGKLKIITFVEYCYAVNEMSSHYGLFLYLFNPTGVALNTTSGSNKVQLGVSNSSTSPFEYRKYGITCVSKSEGDYNNLFYKFKIVLPAGFVKTLNSNSRAYSISGIELYDNATNSIIDHKVAGKWTYTGYAKKCGLDPNAESTLASSVTDIETISLDVKELSYTTKASSDNHLQAVTFNVPNSILSKYGNLDKIQCEWYEYKLKDAFVTSNNVQYNTNAYDKLVPYLGVTLTENVADCPTFSIGHTSGGTDLRPTSTYDWAYNIFTDSLLGTTVRDSCDTVYLAFNSGNADPLDYTVPSELIKAQIKGYNKTYNTGKLDIKSGTISNDIFMDSVDAGRTRGYNNVVIDSNGSADLFKNTDDNFWNHLFGTHNEVIQSIKPLVKVDPADFNGYSGTNDQIDTISAKYKVDASGVKTLADQVSTAKLSNSTTYDMRVAITDTTSTAFDNKKGYKFSQTVLLDFDIITLTFSKEGTPTIIPVVSNPIDIAGDVPPADKPGIDLDEIFGDAQNWWDQVKGWITIIGIILLLLILAKPMIKYVIPGIGWLVTAPFRLLKSTSDKAEKSSKSKAKEQKKGNKSEVENARKRFK